MQAAFVGFGELGTQLHNLAEEIFNKSVDVICFDDNLVADNKTIFPFKDYLIQDLSAHAFFVCLGYKHLVKKSEVLNSLQDMGRNIPPIIHPSGYVSGKALIKEGCYIYPLCNIDKGVVLEKGVLLNNSVTVSHNCHIGECCYVSPGVILSGNVRVGENTFIGSGAIVSNGISIGKNVIVGIGAVVTQDVPDGASIVGNPDRILSKRINLR